MKIDRKTLKKVKEIKVNHSEDESVFFYSDDKNLYKYKFDGEKMHLEASSKIAIKGSWKNGYISSFFLK